MRLCIHNFVNSHIAMITHIYRRDHMQFNLSAMTFSMHMFVCTTSRAHFSSLYIYHVAHDSELCAEKLSQIFTMSNLHIILLPT